MNGVRKLELF